MARWMSNDWCQRNESEASGKSPAVNKEDRERGLLYDEVKILMQKGRIKTAGELFDYFPRADKGILAEIAGGLNLG
jgi:hypothetical protein